MKRHLILTGCILTLSLAGVAANLFAATNETIEVVAKQKDNPQQNPTDIEGFFQTSPTADKDEIHVTNNDVKGQGAGVYNDPVNDGALLTITQDSGPVKVDVEGREGIGAIYWVTVSPGGSGGPDGAPSLLWADVGDLQDPGALVLEDALTEENVRDHTNDDSDAPLLYCLREAGATADVEFWLEDAVGGTFTWTISRGGMVVDSGFLNGDNGYSGSSSDLEWGYYTIDIAKPGNMTFSRKIIFLVTGVDLDIDSDNNNDFTAPDRNEAEEEIENDPEETGKFVVENSDDNDNSGTRDWIEFHVANEQFVPLVLQGGKFTCDPEDAVLSISYSASDPTDLAEYEGEMQPRRDPQTGLRPAIRIWTKPGSDQRDSRGVNAGGDYLAPGSYAWNKFTADGEGNVTLYVEGIGHGETTISVSFAIPDPEDPEEMLSLGSDAVKVTVLPRPRAIPDSYEVTHSTPTYFAGEEKSLLVNDIAVSDDFSEGKRRNVILFDGQQDAGKTMDTTAGGSVTVDDSGGLVYTPPALWAGTDTFKYKVGNGDIYSAPATVTISVTNTVPTIQGSNYSVVHGKSLRVPAASGVLANAADPEDKPFLTATVVQQPSHGTLTLHASGAFIYTPDTSGGSHYVGQDSFTYKANDGISDSAAPATVQVQVTNTAPGGTADTYEVPFGGRKLMVVAERGVLRNDSDGDGDSLKATLVQGPSNGTLDLRSSGAFIYTITTPFAGTDTFTYHVNDGAADSDPITVTLQHGQGETLGLQDDTYSIACGRVLVVTLDNGVLANDSIPGESSDVTVEVVGTVPEGLTFHNSGIFSYEAGDTPEPVTFSYRVTHATGLTDQAQVTINVSNSQPTADNASYSASAGRKLIIDRESGLSGYASDSDGDKLTFTAGSGQVLEGDDSDGPGQIDVKSSGAFVYTPPSAAFVGVVEFTYTVSDGIESSQPGEVTITVTRDNAVPTISDRDYTVFQRDQLVVSRADGLLAGAMDKEGDPISVTVTNPTSLDGTLTYQPGGSFKYVPPTTGLAGQGDLNFQESVQFVVHDPFGESQPATVTFTVANKAPVGTNDAYEVDRDEQLVVSQRTGLLNNDQDSDEDILTAAIVSQPANGELLFTSDNGAFIYEPDEGYFGTDSFTYRPSDGFRQGEVVTVTIQVNNTDGPVAANDSYRVMHRNSSRILAGVGKRHDVSTAKDGIIAENRLVVSPWKGVLTNDTDPSGRPLSAVLVSQPGHGTLELDASGSFVYVPTVGYVGNDSFTYRASNGQRTTDVATVQIEVANTAPQAESDSYQVKPDQTLITSARNGVLGNDLDAENDPLTAELVQGVSHGTLNLGSHGGFTYTPEDDYTGSDSFTYRASDGLAYSDTRTVTIVVTETPQTQAPVARNDSYSIRHDTTLNAPASAAGILGNDYTFNDGGLTAELVTDVAHGTLTLTAGGGFTYVPGQGYVGTDSFTYKAKDAYGLSAAAMVTINVTNAVPVATNRTHDIHSTDSLDVAWLEGLVSSVNDEDGDSITASLVTDVNPQHGTLTFNSDGSYTFVPAAGFKGTASFTYTLSDGIGTSSAATVTIEVANNCPVAANDTYTIQHDHNLVVDADKGLLANDFDGDGDRLTLDVPTTTGLTVWPTGAFVYTPAAGFVGQVTVNYTIHDGTEESQEATVTIDVTNDAPVAGNDPSPPQTHYEVRHNDVLVVSAEDGILVNDSSPDGDRISWTDLTQPQHGSLTLHANGAFVYTPNSSQASLPVDDSFTYRLTDGIATTDPVTVNIRILYDAPAASNDPVDVTGRKSYRVERNAQLLIYADDGVLRNDGNPEDALLTLTNTSPSHGTLDLRQNGAFVYTPEAGYTGTDSFTYTISDGITESTATVSLAVSEKTLSATDDPIIQGQPSSYSVPQDWVFVLTPDEASSDRWPSQATRVIGSLGSNDTIPDDIKPQFTVVTNVQHGQLHLGAHGGFVYRPTAGYTGADSFTYKIVTPHGDSNVATVRFNVTAVSLTAAPIELTTTRVKSVAKLLDENSKPEPPEAPADQNPTYRPAASIVSQPQHGEATVTKDGQILYMPDGDYIGNDTFQYRWSFNGRNGDPATVTVTVTGSAPSVVDLRPDDPESSLAINVTLGETYIGEFLLTDLAIDTDFDDQDGSGVTAQLMDGGSPAAQISTGDGTVSIQDGKLRFVPDSVSPTQWSHYRPKENSFELRLSDNTSGAGSTVSVKVFIYAPSYRFPNDVLALNPINMGKAPGEADQYQAGTLNARLNADVDSHYAGRVLAWQKAQAEETQFGTEFNAAVARATSIDSATSTHQSAVVPKLYTLGTALVDADAARFSAESDALLAETNSVRVAEHQEWDDVTTAAVTYAGEVHASLAAHAQARTAALVAEAAAASAAQIDSEDASETLRSTLEENLRLVGVGLANARATADASFHDNLETLKDQYLADMQTAAQTRDASLKTAQSTLLASRQLIQATLQSALDTARSTYDSSLQDATDDRDDAISQAQSDLDDAVAAAAAIYAGGTQDKDITAPLALGDNTAYLNAVASAQSTFDAAVTSANDTYDSAVAIAKAALQDAIGQAREDASDAVDAADTTLRSAMDDADATYVSEVNNAVQAYDSALVTARAQLLAALNTARMTYSTALQTADNTFDGAIQDAVQDMYDAREAALNAFDGELVAALNAFESQLAPLDTAYHDGVSTHRNAFDVGQVDSHDAFIQARQTADTAYRQANESAVDAWDQAVFGAAETRSTAVDTALATLNDAARDAEHTMDAALAQADRVYRDAVRNAQIYQQRVERSDAFKTYASTVQTTQAQLADSLDWGVIKRWEFIWDPQGTMDEELELVRDAVFELVKAELTLHISFADAEIAIDEELAGKRTEQTGSYNEAITTYYSALADAQKTFQNARANAEKAYADARADADTALLTTDATAKKTWGIAVTAAAGQWRTDIADLTRTWIYDTGEAGHTYAVGQEQARADHASALALASHTLSDALVVAQEGFATANQSAMADWKTAHDTAAGDIVADRADAMTVYSISLAQTEADLDNALLDAATNLFVDVTGAAEVKANAQAQALRDYVTAVADAGETFQGDVLGAAVTCSGSLRVAFADLIEDVHDARVSAVATWHASENTNWSTYVNSVALAEQTHAEADEAGHTQWFTDSDPANQTFANSSLSSEVDAANDTATAIATFTMTSTSATTDYEEEAQLLSLGLATDQNDERATYLSALATQMADSETAGIGHLQTYNAGMNDAQETYMAALVVAGTAVQEAIADADEDFATSEATDRQTMNVAAALATKDFSETTADAAQTLGNAEATAADGHGDTIWTAWQSKQSDVIPLAETMVKAWATANKTFNDALADADHTRASGLGDDEGAMRSAMTTANNAASDVACAQAKLRQQAWWDEVVPDLGEWDLVNFSSFFPVHEAALASLEPKWWEGLIPIYGSVYSSANNFSKGEYLWGTVDAVFAVGDVFAVKGAVNGIVRGVSRGVAGQNVRASANVAKCRISIGSAACFVAGTLVQTSSGPVPIECVVPGQDVLAYDQAASSWVLSTVEAVHERVYDGPIVTVTIEYSDSSREVITVTGNHPFWVEAGTDLQGRPIAISEAGSDDAAYVSSTGGRYVEAQHLNLSDRLLANEFQSATVVGLAIRTERLHVYNITVLRLHNYAVGQAGVLVHNRCKMVNGGFKNFRQLKRYLGPAGEGKVWHHIVEQTRGNIRKFGPEAIHNVKNVVALPHGKGTIHNAISRFYSSKNREFGDMVFRKWLSTKSFDEQFKYGLRILKRFGA